MELRVLSFNIHKGVGWKSHKSTIQQIQSQINALLPDIIFLQEVLGTQFETYCQNIWPHFSYGKNCTYKNDHQGNAILSKLPITQVHQLDLSTHRYEHRGLLHTIVQPPDSSTPLHLINVHLGLFPNDRRRQIDKIIEHVKANIPNNMPLILGGDFNDWNHYASKPLRLELELNEAFLELHKHHAKTYPAWSPFFKLDRIYYRGFHPKSADRMLDVPWRNLSDHIGIEVLLALIEKNK